MKWNLKPPGNIAYTLEGYTIHISGDDVMTYICQSPSRPKQHIRIGKFTDKEQAKACCEKHYEELKK